MRARLSAGGYALAWRLSQLLPERLVLAIARLVADRAFRRNGRAVQRLRGNLARVVGPGATAEQLDRLTRAGLRSYSRYWVEMFRLPVLPAERIVREMQVENEDLLRSAYAAGNGVILALPHSGNWDHAGAWAVSTGMPFTTVAERLQPESLFDRFVRFRRNLGMEVLPIGGREDVTTSTLAARLRAGGMVCLLADRDLTGRGVEVQFFGEPARMPAGPAALALSTGAVLLPVVLWFAQPTGWRARILPPVPVPPPGERGARIAEMTQHLVDALATGIAEHPEDWHMLQRVWISQAARSPRSAGVPFAAAASPGDEGAT